MADEIQKLVLQIEGTAKLKALNTELAEEEKHLLRLIDIKKSGVVSDHLAEQGIAESTQRLASMRQEMQSLEKTVGNRGFGAAGTLMQLSYILDDLTNTSGGWERKLASISNNIPTLAASIGGKGSMAIAGAVGIASTALIALAPVAVAAWQAMAGQGGEGPDGVVDALDRAGERVKDLRAEWDKLRKAMTDEEAATKRAMEHAITESGGPELKAKLAGALAMTDRGAKPDEAQRYMLSGDRRQQILSMLIGRARSNGEALDAEAMARLEAQATEQWDAERVKVQDQLDAANLKNAETFLAEAPTKRDQRNIIREIVRGNPGAFPRQFAEAIQTNVEPEDRAERQAEDEAIAADQAENERRVKAHAQREKQARRLAGAKAKQKAAASKRKLARDTARDQRRNNEDVRALEDQEADEERQRREAERAAARAPHETAKADVRRMMRQTHVQGATEEQVDQMADEAQRLMADGLSRQQAAWSAVHRKVESIRRTAAAFQQQMARQQEMMAGQQWTGQFSMLPTIFP